MATGTPAFEFRELDAAELENRLTEAKEELFNLRFQAATSQLGNTARLKAVRHDIARMYTVLRERELGITIEPEEKAESDKKTSKKSASKKSSEKTEE